MKNCLIFLSIVGFIPNVAMAEVPLKPSYANTTLKAKEEKKEELKKELAEEKESIDHARGMLNDTSEFAEINKKDNVLKKTKAGRLAESNKHLDK